MKLKTLSKIIYIPGTLSELKHVKIVNHEGVRTIIWEGKAIDLQNCPIIDEGWCFVEILVDHTNPNENNIPDCDKGIIITVI